MKSAWISTFFLVIASSLAHAAPCSVAQVESFDSSTGQKKFGNAIAISSSNLMVNDHTLTADTKQIQVTLPDQNRTVKAEVIHRDFHTDLAILKITGTGLTACPIATSAHIQNGQSVQIIGAQKGSSDTQILSSQILDNLSKRLQVPGAKTSLEIKTAAGINLDAGRSGSAVVTSQGVVGILSQKTSEGTVLAIPADMIEKKIEEFKRNQYPLRNYKFDYRKGTIEFRGLQLENSGTPHEGLVGGNPHEGFVAGNKPISLEDHDLGYASLIVSDLSVLQYFEPAVAKALREAKAQKIFIAAIDNKPIHNEFEFLQVVGECQSCKITRYWVQVENPQDISNKNLRVIALTTKLVDVLDQSKLDREFVSETIAQIKVFHTALSQKQQEAEQGLSNPKTNEQVSAYWEKVEQHLDKIFQPEDLIELLNQIRREL